MELYPYKIAYIIDKYSIDTFCIENIKIESQLPETEAHP